MSSEESERLKKKSLLQSYYGGAGGASGDAGGGDASSSLEFPVPSSRSPLDLNSTHFEPEKYLSTVIKEKTLAEIMDLETDIIRETKKLDSEMQTLVSENYNKFISATDTIRKMRNDFKKMEDEMENLVVKMAEINGFNESINSKFKDNRQEISKLSGISNLLKKLQFLFDLPSKLSVFVESDYKRAVMYYLKACKTLDHYKHMPTFKSIDDDCVTIMGELKKKLYARIESSSGDGGGESTVTSSIDSTLESISLLHQLGEPMRDLCATYLDRVEKSLNKDLDALELDIDLLQVDRRPADAEAQDRIAAMDILEFVDYGCNHFLTNLALFIHSYNSLFIDSKYSSFHDDDSAQNVDAATEKLNNLVKKYWLKYCYIIKKRFELEVI